MVHSVVIALILSALIDRMPLIVNQIGDLMKYKISASSLLAIITMVTMHSNLAFTEIASQAQCEQFHDEIENDFKKANFCEKDGDCKVVQLGGWYIEFGCYKYVNTSTNEGELFDKIHKYKDEMKCSEKINDCMKSNEPVCINKKCASKE